MLDNMDIKMTANTKFQKKMLSEKKNAVQRITHISASLYTHLIYRRVNY